MRYIKNFLESNGINGLQTFLFLYCLVENGADPCLRNVWGFSALYMSTDSTPLLARMLKEPVSVNEKCGEREEVPLHLAAVVSDLISPTHLKFYK